MSSRREPVWLELATIVVFCAFLFFYGLGAFGLVGADEPRYAQIAREMLNRHDWVTPILNGLPWLEKPILYYWGAMISYSIFGVSDWAARVPSAVFATGMIFAVYFFMRRFRRGSQLDAALISASLAGIVGFARAASMDMPLTATFTIAMLCWYAWFETRRKLWLAGCYVFLGLGTLAKGPVAPFLAGLIVLVFIIIRRDWTALRLTLWLPGLVLYFAVTLPWFILVQHANPQFVHVFIFEHNLERYSTNMFQHKQPFWYFVPVLLLGVLPWIVFAIAAFVRAVRETVESRSSFELFFALWAILPVIFFSFSQSKLPGYIVPVLPAFAILAAEYLWRRIDEGDEPSLWFDSLHAFVGGALLGISLLSIYFILRVPLSPLAVFIAVFSGIAIFAGMLVAIYVKGLKTIRLATLVPVVLAMTFILKMASPYIDAKDSQRPVAQALAAYAKPGTPVAVAGVSRTVEYGLDFYRNQPISNYDRAEFPVGDHIVVSKPGATQVIQAMSKRRKVVDLGGYKPQHLEFYAVAGGP
ncbi:MAG: glycosyltransferase family 39 protein [Terriglobales bacterium]